MANKRSLIVILGPTASGKSSLGVKLAKRFHGVVISADSRQVYRGMDLGTGKVTKKEMSGVPHYLLNVSSPQLQYSVAKYVCDVAKVLKRLTIKTPIFMVGGSPFYINALLNPLLISPVPPDPTLRRRLAVETSARLIARLRKLDPLRLTTIDTTNRRRLIRAIEITSYKSPPGKGGVPALVCKTGTSGVVEIPPFRVLKIGIAINKKRLHRNITRRVDTRMRQGMLREVQLLHDQGLSWKKLDAFGLEYRFLSRHLRGQLTQAEALRQLNSATRNFAKRQMTWWKRNKDIVWIEKHSQATRQVKKHLSWSSRHPV